MFTPENRRGGFTLVELAIVLVIVGLLIGGILIGQSMISATRITGQVRQFQQFDIAVSNFKAAFGGLPADNGVLPIKFAQNAYGNRDGILDGCCGGNLSHDSSEFCNFWNQLSTTHYLVDGYTYQICGNPTPTVIPNSTVPAAIIDKTVGVFAYGIAANGKNYYSIVNNANLSTDLIGAGSVIPSVLAAIDSKMDDGIGNTGTVVARAGSPISNTAFASVGTCLVAGGGYNFSTTTKTCIPRVDILQNTGNW